MGPAWFSALLALGCELGAVDVPIGADLPSTFYISPHGSDDNSGTRALPWRTFAHATAQLEPGHTLLLLDGDYEPRSTGLLQVNCGDGVRSGRAGRPILVRAESERRALLHGDGARVPLELRGCEHWVVEGLTLMNEHVDSVEPGTDVGTVAMVQGGKDVALRRLLLLRPNHHRHTHLLRVLEADHVLVEECEAYDFHHNAFEAVRSRFVTFRRNYFHSRYAESAEGTVGTDDPTRGEVAIQIEESSSAVLENNVAEVVGTGFSVVGRPSGSPYTDAPPYPVSGARLFGNVVRDALAAGFKIETRCGDAAPCEAPERIVTDTLVVDGAVEEAAVGVAVDAAPGTRVDNVTLARVADGVELSRGAGNQGLEFSASASRALVRGFSGVAFGASGVADWSFEHCAAVDPGTEAVSFAPRDSRVLQPLSEAGGDDCLVYLHRDSPLRRAAGADGYVGASIILRYLNGAVTDVPLWEPATGAFPCGAVVAGINDDPGQSCRGVHERLRVGSTGCPLPDGESR